MMSSIDNRGGPLEGLSTAVYYLFSRRSYFFFFWGPHQSISIILVLPRGDQSHH